MRKTRQRIKSAGKQSDNLLRYQLFGSQHFFSTLKYLIIIPNDKLAYLSLNDDGNKY